MKRTLTIAALMLMFTIGAEGKKPLIGITTGFNDGYQSTVSNAYAVSVAKAGGIPVLIPLQKDSLCTVSLLRRLDGIVVTGGEDLNPAYYGDEIFNETVEINPERDKSDVLILRCALRRKMPVLGICRGEQILAACLGDKLWQDIPSQIPDNIGHFRTSECAAPLHAAVVKKESRLHKLLQTDTIMVNSFHHQAARGLSGRIKVSAVTQDGIIEAFESGKNIIAVQFHPEQFIAGGDNFFLPLFENLISQAR